MRWWRRPLPESEDRSGDSARRLLLLLHAHQPSSPSPTAAEGDVDEGEPSGGAARGLASETAERCAARGDGDVRRGHR